MAKARPRQRTRRARAVCPECGKELGVLIPAGGDGSGEVYPRHQNGDGERCDGSRAVVELAAYVRGAS